MSELSAKARASLPNSAFAYIDSKGRRRLPIHDEAHLRNALARFGRVPFEDDAARERARTKILTAAKKYGIVPIGFITGELEAQAKKAAAGRLIIELGQVGAPGELEERLRGALRDPTLTVLYWSEAGGGYLDRSGATVTQPSTEDGRAVTLLERHGRPLAALVHDPSVLSDPDLATTVTAAVRLAIENERLYGEVQARGNARTLPTGFVTFLLSDIENSTGLLSHLGERYGALLTELRRVMRGAVRRAGGREVDARADEFFAVFESASAALQAALGVQRAVRGRDWPDGVDVRLRIGIHSGRPALSETGYIGLPVHTAARVCSAAHGGQILLTDAARQAVDGRLPEGVSFRSLGRHRLHGLPEEETLFQADAPDLPSDFPPPRTAAASFIHHTGHWRPRRPARQGGNGSG
jgi:class 3 adenylate cyclase